MIRNPRFHRRRNAQSLVNAGEIIVHIMQGDCRFVVLNFLGKCVCQPHESAHRHPHREILPFHMACRNVRFVRRAGDRGFACAYTLCWRITHFATFRRGAVNFNQSCVINVRAKSIFNRVQIGLVAVCRQLDAMRQPPGQIVYKMICRIRVACANKPARDKFRGGVERNPCPHTAPAVAPIVCRHIFFFAANKAPNFIALNPFAIQVAKGFVLIRRARRAKFDQKFLNRGAVNARHADKDRAQEFSRMIIHSQQQGLFVGGRPPLVDGGVVLPEFAQPGTFPAATGFGAWGWLADEVGEMAADKGGDRLPMAFETEAAGQLIGYELKVGRFLQRDKIFKELAGGRWPIRPMAATGGGR